MTSGQRQSNTITLNPAEREIAHISFPNLSKAQAELEYARNKQRYGREKAEGYHQDRG